MLDDQQLETIENWISYMSDISVSAKVETEGSEDIVVLDVVSITVTIVRNNLKENERAGPVVSQAFPFVKYEKFYVYLTDITDTNIFSFLLFDKTDREQKETIKFQAPPNMIGDIVMKVHVFSDSYIDSHPTTEVRFTIKKESNTREFTSYHEEDIKREPTLFEQVMSGMNEANSDDDLEEDETKETTEAFDSQKAKAKISDDEESEEKEKDD